jgi:hypothetical protein
MPLFYWVDVKNTQNWVPQDRPLCHKKLNYDFKLAWKLHTMMSYHVISCMTMQFMFNTSVAICCTSNHSTLLELDILFLVLTTRGTVDTVRWSVLFDLGVRECLLSDGPTLLMHDGGHIPWTVKVGFCTLTEGPRKQLDVKDLLHCTVNVISHSSQQLGVTAVYLAVCLDAVLRHHWLVWLE